MRKEDVLSCLPEGPRKEAAERAAALIHCFRCLDTGKEFKERKVFMFDWLDGNGSWDFLGCPCCNPCGWCGFAHTNHPRLNDIQVFHANNNQPSDRAEQLVHMGSKIPIPQEKPQSEPKPEPKPEPEPEPKPEVKEDYPIWDMYKEVKVHHEQKTLDIDAEIGNIATNVYNGIMAYGGDLSSLAEMLKGITLRVASSMSEMNSHEELFERYKTKEEEMMYILLRFQKKQSSHKIKVAGLFSADKDAFEFNATIFLLKPGNEMADKKCNQLMDKSIQNRINNIKESLEI